MHIKHMKIEGFKSYGKSVEVGPFDEAFNAITGLNGSGKSNILDAICFVLGSSNMSLARVSNLRELIYKSGQAGVVKANVQITFDNTDKKQQPTSYENYPEITVTREVNLNSRSKYLINGFVATTQQVQDLFHSVQLNINNPHFLIMQGRITKVLNMKPQEILAMVEEATGASRYELKKKSSQAMMEKKQTALNTIDNLLNETILPNLEKLKKEQSGLKEYHRVNQELEHLTKVYTAYNFIRNQELCDESGTKVTEKQKTIEDAHQSIAESEETIKEIAEQLTTLELQKDKEFGGHLKVLEEELKNVQMNETKLTSLLNNKKDGLKEAEKKKSAIEKQLAADAKLMKQRQGEYSKIRTNFDKIDEDNKRNEVSLEKAQRDFEAISAGASRAADGEAAGTLKDQLIQAKKEIGDLGTEITTSNMKLTHARKELSRKQAEVKKMRGSLDQDAQRAGQVRSEVQRLRSQLESHNFDEDEYRGLIDERKLLAREVGGLSDHIQNKESQNSRTQFQHWAPNFDNRLIIGMVCNLLKVKDPKTALALEEVAGGNLYQVVVTNTDTAKTLLDRGQLKKKVTFLPLDKIKGRQLDRNCLRNAERLVGRENVQAAIDLVEYEPHLEEIMRYAFGDTLICPDMDTAKKVAFDPGVKKRVVTLEGDLFDPSGTLRGGSRDKRPTLLIELSEMNERKQELVAKRLALQTLDEKLRSLEQDNRSHGEAKRALDIKSHELELIEKNLENTHKYQLQQEIQLLTTQVQELETSLENLPQRKKAAEKMAKDIEDKVKNSKGLQERELKEAQEFLKKAQADYDKLRKVASEKTHEVDTIRLEVDELSKTIEGYEAQLAEFEEQINGHKDEVDEAAADVQEAKQEVAQKVGQVRDQKQLLKNKSDEISKLGKKRDQLTKLSDTKKLDIKKLQHELEQIKKDSGDAAHKVRSLLKKHPWIADERSLFGNEAAGYPFKKTDFDINQVVQDIEANQARKVALSKTVNMRAGTMLTDRENEATQVAHRRKIVDADKHKLINYMQEVDFKKKEELEKAFVVINENFASIFKSMLPGTDAKLAPPHGKTIHEGLEVKVAFGDIWKETLTELSGGQRSLVALSLILALLRYNPAPIYILDEVDAALDQSHTTNIGKMIKDNFPNSQFIIVSLKDDMFNNANVLFKTHFVDGSSTVKRSSKGPSK